MNLWDARESARRKEAGIALAAAAKPELLAAARTIAKQIATVRGQVHMDQVAQEMERGGMDPVALGPAAGSVFKSKEWEWTGEFVKSERITNHSRLLRVWRLK